jgi:hypothetical protein
MSQYNKENYVSPAMIEREDIFPIVPLAAVAGISSALASAALSGLAAGAAVGVGMKGIGMRDNFPSIVSDICLEPII